MGIARFYRWLSERYPLINEVIEVDNVPEFDNFYLDMNGIIHHCSHGNTGGRKQASEDHMWLDVFKYISGLVYRIKPKKLLYLAVDGVAPRAKMNQQRSRRFRAAHDSKESRDRNSKMNGAMGKTEAGESGFDSNCITPGTEFMERLVYHLEFFVQKKIAEDPLWKDLKVVLSGPDVPGEGEHKIMDYIRSEKSQPDYNPNTRHCLYGLDADLVMLSLVSHEPYFALLREEIDFSFSRTKSKENRSMVKADKFQLLHIGILREYLGLEFLGDKYINNEPGVVQLLDRVIDDFILFCFLVGNDFLPHLPFAEIGEGGLSKLFACYKDLMNIQGEQQKSHFLIKPGGVIDYANLYIFLERYMVVEYELVDALLAGENWKIGQTRICNSETPAVPAPSEELYKDDQDPLETVEVSEALWSKVKKIEKKAQRRVSSGTPESVEIAMDEYYEIKLGFSDPTTNADQKSKLVLSYLEGLQWVYWYYYKGPPSWDWYYPYHYSPFAVDVVDVLERIYSKGSSLSISFEQGKPFLPFQQLMAVLPPASGKNFLPQPLYNLMVSPQSPIRHFYPEEFQIDIDGVRVPWGGVTIIPFVDEKLLVASIEAVISQGGLSEAETKRNSQGVAKLFSKRSKSGGSLVTSVTSTIPGLVKDVSACKIYVEPFTHKALPEGMGIFPHRVLEGYSASVHGDFPSLFKYSDKFIVNFSFGSGVRIFNSTSKQESLFIHLTVRSSRIAELEKISSWIGTEKIAFNFPFYSKRLSLVSLTDGNVKLRFSKRSRTPQPEMCERNKHEGDIDWLLSKLEESGITIDIETMEENMALMYAQPVVELSADLQRPETVKALGALALVVVEKPTLVAVRESANPEISTESEICLNVNNQQIFGRSFTGTKEKTAVFENTLTVDSLLAINSGLTEILKISNSVKFTQWLSSIAVASSLGVSEDFVWALFGEVWIRFGKFQEEVGMNLWSYASTGEPQCVPGFSKFIPNSSRRTDNRGRIHWNRWDQPDRKEWRFSSEAVNAVKDFMRDMPELTQELRESVSGSSKSVINGGITLQGKRLFARFARPANTARSANSRDDWVSEFYLNKIVGFTNSAKWKNISICPWNYEFVGNSFVGLIASFLDLLRPQLKAEEVRVAESATFPMSEATLASALKNGPEIALGQRGIYVKPNGLVPVGTYGTVIGFYGSEIVDILLDEESMNASSLSGLCPDMRGIRINRRDWRAPKPLIGSGKDPLVTELKNKILAKLIVDHDKAWKSTSAVAKETAIQPAVNGAIQPVSVVPPAGIKLSVQDLFATAAQAAKKAPLTAPRRPPPPTAMVKLPAELGIATSQPEAKIPNFLLEKLRPPPPK